MRTIAQEPTYQPKVGDKFHCPARTIKNPLTGKTVEQPEQHCKITSKSHQHVVTIINGLEYTFPIHTFLKLAKSTLQAGATLTRKED